MKDKLTDLKKIVSNFKELIKNPRYRAITILILYIFFFAFIIISLRTSNTKNYNQKESNNNYLYSLNKIKSNNYHYKYEVDLNNSKIIYEGDRYLEKEKFIKTENMVVETYYNYNGTYLKEINNVWSKIDNPYLYKEFKDLTNLEEILKNATYESKTEFNDNHNIYTYKISTTSLIKIVENKIIDLDDVPNTIVLTTNEDNEVTNIELDLVPYINYTNGENNELKIILSYSKFGEIEEFADPD